jgi:very-short-patch-repair endonuclease
LFQVTSELIGLRQAPRNDLELGDPESLVREGIDAMRDAVKELSGAAEVIPTALTHPFRSVSRGDWSPTIQRQAEAAILDLRAATRVLGQATTECRAALGFTLSEGLSLTELERLDLLVATLEESPGPPVELVAADDWEEAARQTRSWIRHGKERDALHGELAPRWNPDGLIELDLDLIRERFARWAASFFLIAWIMLFRTRRILKGALASGHRLPPSSQIPADIDKGIALRQEETTLRQVTDEAIARLGRFWRGADSDWDGLRRMVDWCERFRPFFETVMGSSSSEVAPRLSRLASQTEELRAAKRELCAFRTAFGDFRRARQELADLLGLDEGAAWGDRVTSGYLSRVETRLEGWIERAGQLRDWCVYQRACDRMIASGLSPLAQAHRRGELGTSELRDAFERSFREAWWNATVDADPQLAHFLGAQQDQRIDEHRRLDLRSLELAQRLVQVKLEQSVAEALQEGGLSEQISLLRRELKKKRRHLPMRRLFQSIPDLLSRLTPCMLMSPLSVAQYLDTDFAPFDVVVFDEASQIPVWDGVGAVARGQTVIVVGDSQQLPPTSFFQGGEGDEYLDEDDFEELESILDECVAAGLTQHRLRWHYRSRHEGLITFSNYHYYANQLQTFPCAEAGRPDLGVSLRPVPEGFYDRSKTRTNRAEAEAVVEDIVRRLADPAEQSRSIGVVTFSQAQQSLVEDLLDQARRDHPEIEPFFGDGVSEPLFVKNLENVQGDERDVILFSVCYGPDHTGKVSMTFGPLNRQGGHRRLNVAVTRARQQLLVFSTLRADQVDLTRTSSEAVRHLRTFLDYAERGPRAIDEALRREQHETGSPLEREIARELRSRGWEVQEQVGCSEYRIDLAVVDPRAPGRYLLGIECDGSNYRSAANARDRDRLRAQVLGRLGWRLIRVWSTDFWLDPARELARIDKALGPRPDLSAQPANPS